jgi:hypothetical protein
MNGVELIVAIAAGGIALFLIVKLWRFVLGVGVLGALIVGALCVTGQIDCPIGNKPKPRHPGGSGSSSSNADVITAVYQHLIGKKYTTFEQRPVTKQMPCSQQDDDFDPIGKRNPNAGKCRGTGGYGFGYKTVTRTESTQILRQCPTPPPVNSSLWRVQSSGRDKWTVYGSKGSWTVEKVGSGYRITAHQRC